jgi:hypothetical protein
MATATTTVQQAIDGLYITLYNRAADSTSYPGWGGFLGLTPTQVAGQITTSAQYKALANAFINPPAGSAGAANVAAYYNQTYGSLNNIQFIQALYQNLGGLPGESAGVLYWSGLLNAGQSRADVLAQFVQAFQTYDLSSQAASGLNAADYANALIRQQTFNNKILVSQSYASASSTSKFLIPGAADANDPGYKAATNAIQGVGADLASVQNAQGQINAAVAAGNVTPIVGQTPPSLPGSGTTYTLTTSADTITGTAGNDTVNGLVDGTTAANSTLTAADSINGGLGSNTLNITAQGGALDVINGALVSNIQTVSVRAVGTAGVTLDATNTPGLTKVISDLSTQGVTVTKLATGATAQINGNGAVTNGNFWFGYKTAADAATLNVNGGTTAGNVTISSAPTAVTLTSTGAANEIGTVALGGAATGLTVNATTNLKTGNITGFTGTTSTITVSGAATTVDLATIENTTVKTIDASGLTAGGVTATLNNNTGIKFTGGAGNDIITTGAVLVSGASVDAGAGNADALVVANTNHITATTGAFYKGFEVLSLSGAVTVDADNLAGTNTFGKLVLAGGGAQILSNLNAATAGNVQIVASDTPTIGVKGATTVGQLDTVAIEANDTLTAVNTITLTNPTLAGIETLKLTATDNITINSLTNATALTSITATGAGTVSITTGGVAANSNESIDLSAVTGAANVINASAATTNGLSLIGSSTKATTITGSSQADVIKGGAGNDTLSNEGTGVTATKGDLLTGGAGNDTFALYGSNASAAIATAESGAATILDFTVGTTTTSGDILQLSATQGNYGSGTAFGASVAAAALGSVTVQNLAQNSTATMAAGLDVVKLTTGVATAGLTLQQAFDAAIGSGSITGAANSNSYFVSFYDTTNSKAVIAIVDDSNGTATAIEAADAVTIVGSINMTAADYANFGVNNVLLVA